MADNSPKSESSMVTQTLLTRSLKEHLTTAQALLDSRLSEIEQAGEMICQTLGSGKKISHLRQWRQRRRRSAHRRRAGWPL